MVEGSQAHTESEETGQLQGPSFQLAETKKQLESKEAHCFSHVVTTKHELKVEAGSQALSKLDDWHQCLYHNFQKNTGSQGA